MSLEHYQNGLFAKETPVYFNRYASILESDNTGFWAIARLPFDLTVKCGIPADTALILTIIDNMGSYSYLKDALNDLEKAGVMAVVDSSEIRIRASGVRVKRNDGLSVTVSGRFELQAKLFGEFTTLWTTGEATLESNAVFYSNGLLFNAILDAYVTMNSDKAFTDTRIVDMVKLSRKDVTFYEKPQNVSARSSFSLKTMFKF